MASPVDSARVTSTTTTANTAHTINVGSPIAGTLLIVLIRFAAAPGTITFNSTSGSYTQLISDASDATTGTTVVFYRWADGVEGANDALTTVNSVKMAALAWEITGAVNPATTAPQISTVAVGTTTANTANPGSRAVTGGPKDVLYLAMMTMDGETNTPTASPTNYSTITVANSGTGGATNSNGFAAGGSRAVTASSSDDPGVFTHPAAITGWTAYTVVIHPLVLPPVLEQEAYRFRNDDGDETTATWRQASNTPDTIALEGQFRLRFAVENTGAAMPADQTYGIQYRLKPSGGAFGSWTTMASGSPVNFLLSSNYANGATTQQISGGTFHAGQIRENTSSTSLGVTHPAATTSEFEFMLEVNAATGAANLDEYEFRLFRLPSTVFDTYTQTPSLTIGSSGPFTYEKTGYGREAA